MKLIRYGVVFCMSMNFMPSASAPAPSSKPGLIVQTLLQEGQGKNIIMQDNDQDSFVCRYIEFQDKEQQLDRTHVVSLLLKIFSCGHHRSMR